MSTTAERIPLYTPPPEIGEQSGNSVLCRAVTHRGLVRLRNEDSFCVLSKDDQHLFSVAESVSRFDLAYGLSDYGSGTGIGYREYLGCPY